MICQVDESGESDEEGDDEDDDDDEQEEDDDDDDEDMEEELADDAVDQNFRLELLKVLQQKNAPVGFYFFPGVAKQAELTC